MDNYKKSCDLMKRDPDLKLKDCVTGTKKPHKR